MPADPAPAPGLAVTLPLPERLRLPDLSTVRTATPATARALAQAAYAAFMWGPDQRNGCTRRTYDSGLTWANTHTGAPASPDEWTPTQALTDERLDPHHRHPRMAHPAAGLMTTTPAPTTTPAMPRTGTPAPTVGPVPAAETTDPAPILLPAHLRLPDLSTVRHVTAADLTTWHEQAHAALCWGPDQRNGCTRRGTDDGTAWHRTHTERPLSPDEWTPSHITQARGLWWFHRNLSTHLVLYRSHLAWLDDFTRHRVTGPAVLVPDEQGQVAAQWWWHGTQAPDPLDPALTQAWADTDMDDDTAAALLDAAARVPFRAPRRHQTTATVWLARVLAANPSERLTPAIRAWLALLTT